MVTAIVICILSVHLTTFGLPVPLPCLAIASSVLFVQTHIAGISGGEGVFHTLADSRHASGNNMSIQVRSAGFTRTWGRNVFS